MKHLKFTLMCVLLALSAAATAQHVVQGRVLDRYGNPISDAKVQGKEMATYTETAIDGSFVLETAVPVKKLMVTAFGKAPRLKKKSKVGSTDIVMDDLNWYNEKQDYMRWFLLAQCGLLSKDSKDVPFGVMFGQVKKFGWYGKLMFSGLPSTIETQQESYEEEALKTGNIKTGFFSASVGAVVRIYGPLHFYFGGGFAYRKVAFEGRGVTGSHYNLYNYTYTYGDQGYWESSRHSLKGPVFEVGAMVNLKYVTINLGSSFIYSLFDFDHGTETMNTVHFGIGYTF